MPKVTQRKSFYFSTFLLLKELSLISHAYVQSRLVVILLLELAIAVFCLHADLRQRIVVDAAGEDLLACILLRSAEARVVVFEVAEDVHLLTGCAQLLYLREDVVAYFHACGNGVRTEHLIRLVWLHVLCVRLAHSANRNGSRRHGPRTKRQSDAMCKAE